MVCFKGDNYLILEREILREICGVCGTSLVRKFVLDIWKSIQDGRRLLLLV